MDIKKSMRTTEDIWNMFDVTKSYGNNILNAQLGIKPSPC